MEDNSNKVTEIKDQPKTEPAKKLRERSRKKGLGNDIPESLLQRKSTENKAKKPSKNFLNKEKKILYFCTSNPGKFSEIQTLLKEYLPDIEIRQNTVDLTELQGEPEEIAQKKLLTALDKSKGPLLIEDTSLCFNAFKGLPGPYIKDFFKKLGCDGLAKMVSNQTDNTAYAQTILGIAKNKKTVKLFIGRTDGEIVPPRGELNFGWDPIFQVKGLDKTYAELGSEKNKVSHRFKAFDEMVKFLRETPDFI